MHGSWCKLEVWLHLGPDSFVPREADYLLIWVWAMTMDANWGFGYIGTWFLCSREVDYLLILSRPMSSHEYEQYNACKHGVWLRWDLILFVPREAYGSSRRFPRRRQIMSKLTSEGMLGRQLDEKNKKHSNKNDLDQLPWACYIQLHSFIPSTARGLCQDPSRCKKEGLRWKLYNFAYKMQIWT